jgi:hypothetical protein
MKYNKLCLSRSKACGNGGWQTGTAREWERGANGERGARSPADDRARMGGAACPLVLHFRVDTEEGAPHPFSPPRSARTGWRGSSAGVTARRVNGGGSGRPALFRVDEAAGADTEGGGRHPTLLPSQPTRFRANWVARKYGGVAARKREGKGRGDPPSSA